MALTCIVQLFLAILLSWFLALGVCFSTMQAAAIPYNAPTCSRCVKRDYLEIITEYKTVQKKQFAYQITKYDLFFFSCVKSLIMCMINKMKMNQLGSGGVTVQHLMCICLLFYLKPLVYIFPLYILIEKQMKFVPASKQITGNMKLSFISTINLDLDF